jgi:enoyl-CoA hydratase/carnithine racemase
METLTLTEPAAGVALVTLNRPDRLNAMTNQMFEELDALAQALRDRIDVRVVILTGAGRAFCAGFDLQDAEGLASLSPLGMLRQQESGARSVSAIRGLPQPVIAAVNGAAAGGGLALALAACIRIGSPGARFNGAFVRIGLSAGDLGTSWHLTRLIGPGRAAEMAYTGRFVEADEAERSGLVNRIVPEQSLLDEALALAAEISANSPGGVRLSKRAMQVSQEVSYAAALELENRGQALLSQGEDMPEALAAFKARRPPDFTGR